MARKYTMRSKEEKLAIVKEILAGKSIRAWEPEIRSLRGKTRLPEPKMRLFAARGGRAAVRSAHYVR